MRRNQFGVTALNTWSTKRLTKGQDLMFASGITAAGEDAVYSQQHYSQLGMDTAYQSTPGLSAPSQKQLCLKNNLRKVAPHDFQGMSFP